MYKKTEGVYNNYFCFVLELYRLIQYKSRRYIYSCCRQVLFLEACRRLDFIFSTHALSNPIMENIFVGG
jgi:hypothetical protein